MAGDAKDIAAVDKQPSIVATAGSEDCRFASSDSGDGSGFTLEETRRITRRMDVRLIIILAILEALSILDKSNMGMALITGMGESLNLTGERYNVANLMYFVTYIIVQPAVPYLVHKMGPRWFLTSITLIWGVITISIGFANNHRTLIALRALLGVFEAGLIPGCQILLSAWYTRYQTGKRFALYFVCANIISSSGGILSYGLVQMDGIANLEGWRWIFIMEGILTVAIGIVSYWIVADFPTSGRIYKYFLNKAEVAWVVERIRQDHNEPKPHRFELGFFLKSGFDWRIWAYAYTFFCANVINFGLVYSLPIILRLNMGFSLALSQILIMPPTLFSALVMFASGWLGDRFRLRGPFILGLAVVAIMGSAVTGWAPTAGARYMGVFFVACAAQGIIPVGLSFQANNVRGHWRRGFSSMLFTGFGSLGGMAGSVVFRSQDKTTGYRPGWYACFAAAGTLITAVLILEASLWSENKKADQQGKMLENDEAEDAPEFRYTY